MLTGDKQETAIEIAQSCRLIDPQMQLVKVNSPLASQHFSKPKTSKFRNAHVAAQKEVCDTREKPEQSALAARF